MNNDEAKLKDFLKGVGEVPPCPTDRLVNSFLLQMNTMNPPIQKENKFPLYSRIAAGFILVSVGIGAWFVNQDYQKPYDAETVAIASITDPDALNDEVVSETLIYGGKSEDAFAASLVGSDDIATLVEISDP